MTRSFLLKGGRRRSKVLMALVAVSMLVGVGLMGIDKADASVDPYGDWSATYAGCDKADSNSWGYGCVGVNFDIVPGLWSIANVSYSVADRLTDGHYVYVQRNLSWIDDKYRTMETASSGRVQTDNESYGSRSGRYIDVRIKRSGIGDTLYVGRIYLRG